jgi:hypothetical protein
MKRNLHTYLIIGGGHFGSRAAKKLLEKDSRSKIIIVDKNRKALQKVSRLPIETIHCDGITYLDKFLSEARKADSIIPAVPFHLVFEFILSQVKQMGAKRRKIPSLSGLPNPMTGKIGDLYTSLADFLCPEDCPEPFQYCTITRKRRIKPLYKILEDLGGSIESKVIRSHSLGPGVGGFPPEKLWKMLNDIHKRYSSERPLFISTACLCHGVTSSLSF